MGSHAASERTGADTGACSRTAPGTSMPSCEPSSRRFAVRRAARPRGVESARSLFPGLHKGAKWHSFTGPLRSSIDPRTGGGTARSGCERRFAEETLAVTRSAARKGLWKGAPRVSYPVHHGAPRFARCRCRVRVARLRTPRVYPAACRRRHRRIPSHHGSFSIRFARCRGCSKPTWRPRLFDTGAAAPDTSLQVSRAVYGPRASAVSARTGRCNATSRATGSGRRVV